MKIFFGFIASLATSISFTALFFHYISKSTYPGLIGEYFIRYISPGVGLCIGILAAISLFIWYIFEMRDENEESRKNMRFHDNYGDFV